MNRNLVQTYRTINSVRENNRYWAQDTNLLIRAGIVQFLIRSSRPASFDHAKEDADMAGAGIQSLAKMLYFEAK